MKNNLSKTTGYSTIALVFIIALILGLVVLAMQLNAALIARQVSQIQNSQISFFAAEGRMYQTIQHLKNDPHWPGSFPHTERIRIGDTDLLITISQQSTGALTIDITATTKGTKRRIVANFLQAQTNRPPLDLVLTIDNSGSMSGDENNIETSYICLPDLDSDPAHDTDCAIRTFGRPMIEAQIAAIKFLEYLSTGQDRIGIVSFTENTGDQIDTLGLTNDFNAAKNQIINLNSRTNTWTNIAMAMEGAKSILDNSLRPESKKVIVVMSDGIANQSTSATACTYSDCGVRPCTNPDPLNFYAPYDDPFSPAGPGNLHIGTCCTDDAIKQALASQANPRNYTVFSVLFTNMWQSDCDSLNSTLELARKTIQQMASTQDLYYETASATELINIYNKIAQTVTSPGFFEIKEEIPQPE